MANLGVGDASPYFELPDQQGYPWSLSGQLEMGPVALVFYRGDWCPYCNGQLASYARGFREFERRGAQVAGISVDPPAYNSAMVGKLLLPFPLLSDARGDLAKTFGLWDAGEGVAASAVVVVDRSAEIRYLRVGADFADRPDDQEIFAALDALGRNGGGDRVERITGGPETRLTAAEARGASVRPDRAAFPLDELVSYHRGALFTTVALKGRFEGWGRSGRNALRETESHQRMARGYLRALKETAELRREEG